MDSQATILERKKRVNQHNALTETLLADWAEHDISTTRRQNWVRFLNYI